LTTIEKTATAKTLPTLAFDQWNIPCLAIVASWLAFLMVYHFIIPANLADAGALHSTFVIAYLAQSSPAIKAVLDKYIWDC
jgi:hypothetical protein